MAQPCSAWTRRALVPFDADAALHHPSFEEAPDDLQEALAADPPCQARHQDVGVDPAEGRPDRRPISRMFPIR